MKQPRSTFTNLWQRDGARELEVVVDADLPPFGPLLKRVRGIAAMTKSHTGLRPMLLFALADDWMVTEFPTVGGVTTVRLVPLKH
jgi:hypothetical protein